MSPFRLPMNPDPQPSTTGSIRVTFSPVTGADFDELADLRIAAMRESLERLGRFDPERARERLRKSFSPEHTQFILLDGQRVGFYAFRPAEDGFHLDHLYVHPNCQSQGVGSHVMRCLIAQSDAAAMPVHLGALRDSSSNRFYQRHGFAKTSEDEWDIYYVRPISNASSIIVRHARQEDAPAVAMLLAALGYPATEAQVARRIADCAASEVTAVFVAELERRVVGVESFHCTPLFHADGFLGRITSLVIDPGFRQRGIGRLLVAAAEQFACAHDCVRMEVTSGDHRPDAHAFYEHLGYQVDCRRFLKRITPA